MVPPTDLTADFVLKPKEVPTVRLRRGVMCRWLERQSSVPWLGEKGWAGVGLSPVGWGERVRWRTARGSPKLRSWTFAALT